MKLKSMEFKDTQAGWELSRIDFFPDLTLLVGGSGVGKTRILRSLLALKRIALGDGRLQTWGTSWNIIFSSDDNTTFAWSGRFSELPSGDLATQDEEDSNDVNVGSTSEELPRPRVTYERLSANGTVVIERDEQGIRFKGKTTVKLSPHDSALYLLREEDEIAPANRCFQQILWVNYVDEWSLNTRSPLPTRRVADAIQQFALGDELRRASLPTRLKLAVVHEVDHPLFDRIAAAFTEVFPNVVELRSMNVTGDFSRDVSKLFFKERGVDQWIPEDAMSSGMRRTLMHLSRMALWPDGMAILIDEFENSLGVNCLDEVARSVINESRRLQFVITSHHPYIINNVDVEHWKVVHRRGGRVSATDATFLGLGNSHHDAYIKLLNLPAYQEGVAVP